MIPELRIVALLGGCGEGLTCYAIKLPRIEELGYLISEGSYDLLPLKSPCIPLSYRTAYSNCLPLPSICLQHSLVYLQHIAIMPRTDVEFQTTDGVTLRGWLYRPLSSAVATELPCLVMSHGFSALKEMDLDTFADRFTSDLQISCLVYDNRGFGTSDTGPNQPRHEILPDQQMSDISDAITYAQSRDDVNASKIAIWGSSYSGGHVLRVGAIDRRVKAVLSQVPCVDGWSNFNRLVRPDFAQNMNVAFQQGLPAPPVV